MLLVEEEEHCITFWIDFVNLKTNYSMYRGGILNEISELLINRVYIKLVFSRQNMKWRKVIKIDEPFMVNIMEE